MFQTTAGEKMKIHFTFSNFFFENRAVYEIMGKQFVKPEGRRWQFVA